MAVIGTMVPRLVGGALVSRLVGGTIVPRLVGGTLTPRLVAGTMAARAVAGTPGCEAYPVPWLPPAVVATSGIEGFASGNYLRSAANAEPKSPRAFMAAIVVRSLSVAQRTIVSLIAGTTGYELRLNGLHAFQAVVKDGASGTDRTSPSGQVIPFAHRTVRALFGQITTGGTLQLWLDREYIGETTTAYGAPGASDRFALGIRGDGSFPNTGIEIIGAACYAKTSNFTVAEIEELFDTLHETGDIPNPVPKSASSPTTLERYSVVESYLDVGASMPSSVTAQSLTKTGSLSLVQDADAVFAWIEPGYARGYELRGYTEVMYVGDSTTAGAGPDGDPAPADAGGYREAIYNALQADGLTNVWSIGHLSGGSFANPQHRGIGGSTIEAHNLGGANDIGAHIGPGKAYHPEVIVISLGVNGVQTDSAATLATKMDSLLEYIHGLQPHARIIVGGISFDSTYAATINELNETLYPNLVAAKASTWTSGTIRYSLLFHGVVFAAHPDLAGYQAAAAQLYPDLKAALGVP